MRLVMGILLLMFCHSCSAEEMLYVGHLEYLKLSPGSPCQARNRKPPVVRADGEIESICVSNICGKGEAAFIIDQTIIGKPRKKVRLEYWLDEWCRPGTDMDADPTLLHISGNLKGEYTFTTHDIEHTPEGRQYFFPVYIDEIEDVQMLKLLKDLGPDFRSSDSEPDADELEQGMKLGYLKLQDKKYIWHRAVFIDDLAKELTR